MKIITISFILWSTVLCTVSAQKAGEIDLSHWKLELPTGYQASEWKLSNFQNDRFAKPFFYLDSLDGALVMRAYPAEGKSKAKYTKNMFREQVVSGSNDTNWTMDGETTLFSEFQVVDISKESAKKYHRTLLFQIHGTSSEEQERRLNLSKSISLPLISIYWENERIRIVRKVLKDISTVGDDLLKKDSWKNDEGRYVNKKISFEKTQIKVEVSDGKISVKINDFKPIVYRDTNMRKWPFENYFNVGNYLQTKKSGSMSTVKYYKLDVTH